jgi:endoglucanase
MFDLVKSLTELPGPTGYEEPVQDWLSTRWQGLGLRVHKTPIGNLMAVLGGHGPKLLVGAHADETSYRVKSIDPQGFLWLTFGRGMAEDRMPEPVPLGHPARITTPAGTVEGTFVTATGHVLSRRQRAYYESHALDWLDFYVDVGARSQQEAEAMGIHPGCPVIYEVTTRRNGKNIVGKAMDDRAGLAVMTVMAERIDRGRLQYEVWFVSTVMEEVGLVGARSAIAGFDLGIAVEVGLAGDIPLVDNRQMPVALGRGPVLVHKDMRVHYSKQITYDLARCAGSQQIAVQHATFQNFSSDGLEWIQEGVPTAMVTFPCRYTHSTHETVQESDLVQMANLLAAFVMTPPT